ncbi:MAG: hypothetical protein D6693_04465 [Planctomycetota bacterium]|nr:MAG: hypothetical protein D6693_04465 [Planctomycetota bacterium]
MTRAALLTHTLPDGSAHLDLLIERAEGHDPDERALIAWRLPVASRDAILTGAGGPVDADRLADHRRLYLSHQGPVPGGRGEVRLLASGRASGLVESEGQADAAIDWGAGAVAMRARRRRQGGWRIFTTPLADPP